MELKDAVQYEKLLLKWAKASRKLEASSDGSGQEKRGLKSNLTQKMRELREFCYTNEIDTEEMLKSMRVFYKMF